ncbi:MerR family DNA-binding transcriptional regulator [Bacillus cereus]|uniref:MerR family DNA-binding transcriptional regulator n=1 Tax=Bacillus cereus TaxID=1396 RepID=UPI0018F56261|nr:MerR family transcriptional regulator [Bacillus cereus]
MYTIGQVAKFLSVSRDTLKFYEEKDLVKPKQNIENGYRKYNHFNIYDITTVNFYREMDIEIKGEIEHFTAYDEYESLKKNTDSLKKAVTLTSLRRVVSFNEEGIIEDKFIIVREIEDFDKEVEGEIISYPKCIYTIIEDGRWATGGKSIDHNVEANLRKVAIEQEYELLGLVYINLLLTTYEEGLERIFLEIYAPVK